MKTKMKNRLLITLTIVIIGIAAMIPAAFGISALIETNQEKRPEYVSIPKEDCLEISKQGITSMLKASSELLDRKVDIALSATKDQTDALQCIIDAEKENRPYALDAFVRSRPREASRLLTRKDDTFILSADDIINENGRRIAEFMLMLEKLDRKPEIYEYIMVSYLEDPESFYLYNHEVAHLIYVCETYKERGYDSISEYVAAVEQGTCKNAGDIFIVNLNLPQIFSFGDAERTDLFEMHFAEKAA